MGPTCRYDAKFLGLLESDSDGVGVWSLSDTTIIGSVTSPTFTSMIKLASGGYGSRPLQPGHTLIAVNPMWGGPEGVGQIWERWVWAWEYVCFPVTPHT